MNNVQIRTEKILGANSVVLKVGGIRIEVSNADYQAMLVEIDADLAELHRVAANREKSALERVNKSHEAAVELRGILYERDGDWFLRREKPDDAALEAFIVKYARLMG